MEKSAQRITDYYRIIQGRSNLQNYDFTSASTYETVPVEEVDKGKLSEDLTAKLRKLHEKQNPSFLKKKEDAPIDVVLSLASVRKQGQSRIIGLLLMPAQLAHDGTFSADFSSAEPWIPAQRLSSAGVSDVEVMVGTMHDFWSHRLKHGAQEAPKVETWHDALKFARSLFTAVAGSSFTARAEEAGYEAIFDEVFIEPDTIINANGAILDTYRYLSEQKPDTPLLDQLMSFTPVEQISEDGIDHDLELLTRTATMSQGSMSKKFPLTPSQRRAVHAYLLDSPDDTSQKITAVSGPPGTGKTTLLQSVVATTIVRHALESKPAPLIVGTSTNNQAVTNIIDSFGKVAEDNSGPLDIRWLPQADAPSTSLAGLAAYCPSNAKVQEAKDKGYLVERPNKSGVYTEYSDENYTELAAKFYQEKFQNFIEGVPILGSTTIEEAPTKLRALLTSIDQERVKLIQAYSTPTLSQPANKILKLEARISELDHAVEQEQRLRSKWQELQEKNPAGSVGSDTLAITLNYTSEDLIPAQTTLVEMVDGYTTRMESYYRELSECYAEVARQTSQRNEALRNLAGVDSTLETLQVLGALTAEDANEIKESASLLELDKALDTTVRYTEFWLAVHIYEAQWLLDVLNETIIDGNKRFLTDATTMETYWSQVTGLTPMFVMTTYQLPKYFKLFTKDGSQKYDMGRIDLLIVDEAGQVDTSVGASAFAFPKRAIVVGDVQQLAPVWSIDPTSDQELAKAAGIPQEEWESMTRKGLTASDHSSIMAAASHAGRWSNGHEHEPSLFLSEHFRCHTDIIEYCNELLYKGRLEPQLDNKKYKLKEVVKNPFMFVLFPESRDTKRGSSRINSVEAQAITKWIIENFDYFADIYEPGWRDTPDRLPSEIIGVVTPFAAQTKEITKYLYKAGGEKLAKSITVGTAHRLQGAERPIILFSSVYGDESQSASFVDATLELMNVAVSRAKDLFIVFGGKTRWEDTGPVFSLVKKRAKEPSTANFTTRALTLPEPQETTQSRTREAAEETADMTISQMLTQWREAGKLPEETKLNPREMNQKLKNAGLINQTDGSWCPTDAGASIGVFSYEGGSKDRRFVNVKYSHAAQTEILRRYLAGEL